MGALDRQSFQRVMRELDQVSVAATLTGTSFPKIKQLADMVQPLHDGLVGERPKVRKIRRRLRLALHNLRRSPKDTRVAKRLTELLYVVRDLQQLVEREGLGAVAESVLADDFQIINIWGYTDRELKVLSVLLRRASKLLADVGLGMGTLPVFASPSMMKRARGSSRVYMLYDSRDDVFIANPDARLSGDYQAVLEALAERIWEGGLTSEDRDVWRPGGLAAFASAFAEKLASGVAGSDTEARLAVTVGRLASRWPSAA